MPRETERQTHDYILNAATTPEFCLPNTTSACAFSLRSCKYSNFKTNDKLFSFFFATFPYVLVIHISLEKKRQIVKDVKEVGKA